MSSRWSRTARGLRAAGIATFLAAFSHVAAGGGAPGGVGLVVALALSAMVCVLLAGRRISLPRLSISVLISQFAFHLLFGVGAGDGSTSLVETAGHHGRLMLATVPDAAAAPVHPAHDPALMWVAHGVSAVITIALLQWGERALARLRRLARGGIRSLVTMPQLAFVEPVPPRSPVRADGLAVVDHLSDLGVLFGALRHRGPPVAVATHP
ncbi:hypothetical protein [Herbiconiux daphne]|uniref:Integral membrane protein n=1 Tax=Herbiconiux daphne TaxID=2970914 RepID=A0ABT2H684_9MICO|nr:hypothetical protein [Herbiconiux daphne]MCS5735455.1 hypothetical protein [Herbiconiux daphne]